MEYPHVPPTEIDPERQMFAESLGQAPSRNRLEGRRIIVVGGGQRNEPSESPPIGNGRAICELFAREGASIACLDISSEAAEETCRNIMKSGGKAFPEIIDVADPAAIVPVVRLCTERLGGIDGMVLNVGITATSFFEETVEGWDHNLNVNLRSHMLFCQTALPHMAQGSAIVLMSSGAALKPGMQPAYEVTKGAQLNLTRAVAKAGEANAIRCNCLMPGAIDTPIGRHEQRRHPGRAKQVPFGRQGTGWDVAYAALFLMSHESAYVNAQAFSVDGGLFYGIVRA